MASPIKLAGDPAMLTPAAHRGPVLLTAVRGVLGLIPMEPIGSSMPDPALPEVQEW